MGGIEKRKQRHIRLSLEENVQASYTREVALTEKELQELAVESRGLFDRLPPQYQFLRRWEYV